MVGEPKLQNMIFKAHKNKAKSKRWALYLENWASYDTFRVATWGENLYQTRFSNLKISVSFWDLGPIFCKWAQFLVRSNFYIATWGLTQLLHWFLRGGGWFSPPPPIHGICTPSQVGLTIISQAFHHCFISVSPMFHQWLTSVLPVSYQCLTTVSPLFHQWFTSVLSVLY